MLSGGALYAPPQTCLPMAGVPPSLCMAPYSSRRAAAVMQHAITQMHRPCSNRRPTCTSTSRHSPVGQPVRRCQRWRCRAAGAGEGESNTDLGAAFAQELAARQAAEAAAAEAAAAASFDGAALLALLRAKYGRSYDVSFLTRTYMGKRFVAFNIMWKYMEQQSFGYTQEEYMSRLDYAATVLRAWGAVGAVQRQLASTKERPRVGKAVSLMLDVPEDKVKEWLSA